MSDVIDESEVVTYELRDGVALIWINNQPVNSISHQVCVGLMAALDTAEADDAAQAVVIGATGRNFSSGSALSDFTRRNGTPSLGAVARRVELFAKPVAAAMQGSAIGAGFELALACHLRVVRSDAKLGLPDLKVGVPPGAGGTQRLARLVGAKPALRMLVSANPITAGMGRQIGLVDEVVEDDVVEAAIKAVKHLVETGTPLRRSCDLVDGFHAPKDYLAAVKERRAAHADDPRIAASRIIDLVEAALLMPIEVGLAMEAAAYEDLVEGDQARALRHSFQAERRTWRRGDLGTASRTVIRSVGLVGGGVIGGQIARLCIAAGVPVVLVEIDEKHAAQVQGDLEQRFAEEVTEGWISEIERDRRLQRLKVTAELGDLNGVELVIEAIPEDLAQKQAVYKALGEVLPEGVMLASTSDTIDLDLLAEASGRPDDVFGLRFFAPVERNNLIEVLRPPRAASDLAPAVARFVRALGRTPILPGIAAQGVALPVFAAMLEAADALVLQGATPGAVDAAMRRYGFARGPYRICDAAGLELALSWSGLGPSGVKSALISRLVAQGLTGEAAGLGFYRYDGGATSQGPAPEATALAAQWRHDMGVTPREPTTEEIHDRLVLAMANAGAKLVERGAAKRPADIDAAMIVGFEFPRWEGGPMEVADLKGALQVRNQLRDWAAQDPSPLWQPAGIFDDLIREGSTFEQMNS